MKNWITQVRKGIVEFCVLTLLREGESYGYEITKRLKSLEELNITESTVYPVLTRLRKDGYLSVRVSSEDSDGPTRRYYSLNEVGRSYLEQMDQYWENLVNSINKLRNSSTKETDEKKQSTT